MPDHPVLDPVIIESLRALATDDDEDDFFIQLITIFLTETPRRVAELDAGLQTGNAEEFGRAAHSIKGSSSHFGARELRGLAEQLELGAPRQPLPSLAPVVAQLKTEYVRVRAALQDLLADEQRKREKP